MERVAVIKDAADSALVHVRENRMIRIPRVKALKIGLMRFPELSPFCLIFLYGRRDDLVGLREVVVEVNMAEAL